MMRLPVRKSRSVHVQFCSMRFVNTSLLGVAQIEDNCGREGIIT